MVANWSLSEVLSLLYGSSMTPPLKMYSKLILHYEIRLCLLYKWHGLVNDLRQAIILSSALVLVLLSMVALRWYPMIFSISNMYICDLFLIITLVCVTCACVCGQCFSKIIFYHHHCDHEFHDKALLRWYTHKLSTYALLRSSQYIC